jgi:tRNA dimethylallyltransferase
LDNNTVIILAGPTASGKTALAIEWAKELGTFIISADSRQCFRELNIGVAKPTKNQLETVPHYFINSHSLKDEVNASIFEQLALQWSATILEEREVVIMAGGTGLYIKAFSEGLDKMPAIDLIVRQRIRDQYAEEGIKWLQEQIRSLDPVFYERGEILNPHRLMRALEVRLATGRSILSFRTGLKKKRPFDLIKFGLDLPKEELKRNIDKRVDRMIEDGLVEEVRGLLTERKNNALQTVGYREIIQHLDGLISLDEAVNLIKVNTRLYAKRQLTWLRKQDSIHWIYPGDAYSIKKIIKA